MKKGASHVDWAIGTGLFVVFLILIITFLRPGVEPTYKGSNLLKIIEDRLKEDSYYTVEKQLLSINSYSSCATKGCDIRIKDAANNGLDEEWINNDEIRGYTTIADSLNEYKNIKWDVYNDYCDSNPCEGYYPQGSEKYVLDFNTLLKNGNNIFYILHSDSFKYETYNQKAVYIDLTDTPPPWTCSECLLDGPQYNFTYGFGIPETFKGFLEEKLSKIAKTPYETLKTSWDVPLDKSFRIEITNVTAYECYWEEPEWKESCKEGINIITGLEETEIPPQANVFVKEWKDWMLTPEGELIPLEVNIRIW